MTNNVPESFLPALRQKLGDYKHADYLMLLIWEEKDSYKVNHDAKTLGHAFPWSSHSKGHEFWNHWKDDFHDWLYTTDQKAYDQHIRDLGGLRGMPVSEQTVW